MNSIKGNVSSIFQFNPFVAGIEQGRWDNVCALAKQIIHLLGEKGIFPDLTALRYPLQALAEPPKTVQIDPKR